MWDNNLAAAGAGGKGGSKGVAAPWLDTNGAAGTSPYERYAAASVGGTAPQPREPPSETAQKEQSPEEQLRLAEEDAANTAKHIVANAATRKDTSIAERPPPTSTTKERKSNGDEHRSVGMPFSVSSQRAKSRL